MIVERWWILWVRTGMCVVGVKRRRKGTQTRFQPVVETRCVRKEWSRIRSTSSEARPEKVGKQSLKQSVPTHKAQGRNQ
jgi:hypothetical protein